MRGLLRCIVLCNCCKLNDSTGPQHRSRSADKYLAFPTVRSRLLSTGRDDATFCARCLFISSQPDLLPDFPLVYTRQLSRESNSRGGFPRSRWRKPRLMSLVIERIVDFYAAVISALDTRYDV